MNMVIPDEGKPYWLDRALNPDAHAGEDLLVSLYTNNVFPGNGSTGASFTQPTFAGGGPFTVGQVNWPPAAVVANVAESSNTDVPTWTNTDVITETCYGWFALTSVGELCVAAQRFDNPRVMSPGSTEAIDPFRIKLKTFA